MGYRVLVKVINNQKKNQTYFLHYQCFKSRAEKDHQSVHHLQQSDGSERVCSNRPPLLRWMQWAISISFIINYYGNTFIYLLVESSATKQLSAWSHFFLSGDGGSTCILPHYTTPTSIINHQLGLVAKYDNNKI